MIFARRKIRSRDVEPATQPAAPSLQPATRSAGASASLTIAPSPADLRGIRAIAVLVVAGPFLGTIAAVALAIHRGGVSATALAVFVVSYMISTLGVTVGFHRHFSHRSFKTSPAMQAVFVVLGSTALQGPLVYWVSTHRRHHLFSDTAQDPHSPHMGRQGVSGGIVGFWRSHVGWMFDSQITNPLRFAPDILLDRRIFDLQRRYLYWAVGGLLVVLVLGAVLTRTWIGTLEVFLWAGLVRLFVLHNASWAVGSVSHLTGDRPFDTGDHSANNFWVALFAFGEGLQNNHHAFPRAAVHGLRWREPDMSGAVVRLLLATGLIWDANQPSAGEVAAKREARAKTLA